MRRTLNWEVGYNETGPEVVVDANREAKQLDSPRFDSLSAARNADLLTWGRTFLPAHFHLPPSKMHLWLAEQLDAARPMLNPLPVEEGGRKLNLVGPRGSAKSTVATLAFVLREALSGRHPYIWIVSDTKHQAAAHLDNIKAELLENQLLREAYPKSAGMGPVWRRGAIVLPNGVMIEAFGTGQRIRGRRRRQHRPTLIVCDDLQNDGHIQSALARERSRSWFHGLLMKAGTKRTTIVNLGTALHRECLSMELNHTPGWTSRTFRAIERWPDHMPLWAAWEELYVGLGVQGSGLSESAGATAGLPSSECGIHLQAGERLESNPGLHGPSNTRSASIGTSTAGPASSGTPASHPFTPSPLHPFIPTPRAHAADFYLRNRELMDAGAELLWPEEEDLYTLMCMRAESGHTAFEREKQSAPVNPELCEWPESYFGDWIWFDEWPGTKAEGGIRKAEKDASAASCPSALPLPPSAFEVPRDSNNRLIAKVIALDPSKGVDSRRGDYSAFVMLGVARDGTLLIEADLKRRPTPEIVGDGVELCRRFRPQLFGIESNQFQDLLGPHFAAELVRQGLIGMFPCAIENTINKAVRIRRLGPLLASRRIRFKAGSAGTRMLVEQLKEFPISQHDDGPDALEMALRLAESLLAPTPDDGLGNRLI